MRAVKRRIAGRRIAGHGAASALESDTKMLPGFIRDFREMHAAGVKFLAGRDAAVVFIHPGVSLHGELESLVRNVGLTPVEALRAATVNPVDSSVSSASSAPFDQDTGRIWCCSKPIRSRTSAPRRVSSASHGTGSGSTVRRSMA